MISENYCNSFYLIEAGANKFILNKVGKSAYSLVLGIDVMIGCMFYKTCLF